MANRNISKTKAGYKLSIIMASLVFLFSISLISAEFWACFNYGDTIDYCGVLKADKVCDEKPYCEKCMSDSSHDGCYNVGFLNKCNDVVKNCSAVLGKFNSTAPNLTLFSPLNNQWYGKRSVLLDLKVSELANVYMYDEINGRGVWSKICSDCSTYSKARSFKEGENLYTFRAVNSLGKDTNKTVRFFIDSQKPKILKVEPKKGFTSGDFYIEIKESNPINLTLVYGNYNKGYQRFLVNLSECTSIKGSSEKKACDFSIDLTGYDQQNIDYHFELVDIANTMAISKTLYLDVDMKDPAITNLASQWWNKVGKDIYFNLSIDETNFDEIQYRDNTATLPKWRTLCSSLRNNYCTKKITIYKDIPGSVDIQVLDEAANSVGERVIF